jgi:hypothetical protein
MNRKTTFLPNWLSRHDGHLLGLDTCGLSSSPTLPRLRFCSCTVWDPKNWIRSSEPSRLRVNRSLTALDVSSKWAVSPKGCPYQKCFGRVASQRRDFTREYNRDRLIGNTTKLWRSGLASTLLPKFVLTGEYEHLSTYPIPAFAAFVELIKVNGL